MKYLVAALLLVAAPAYADMPELDWARCVVGQLAPAETQHGSVATWGVKAAIHCKSLYRGDPDDGSDVRMAVRMLETIRETTPVATSKPVPLPPIDRRF